MAEMSIHPFSDADVEKLAHEESSTSEVEGWKFVSKSDFTDVWKKTVENQHLHLVKGYLRLPNIPVDAVVDLVSNVDVRKRWDTQFPTVEVVEQYSDYCCIYWEAKMPVGVTNRDLLQFMWIKKDESTNATYVVFKNAVHPKVPEKKGLIRAETLFSGLVIRPEPEDPIHSSRLSILTQTDAKGHVPKFVINLALAKSPDHWRQLLVSFYHNVYTKQQK